MNLVAARQAVVDGLIAGTKTPSDDGSVESVSIGAASKTDCRVCLKFRVDRYEAPRSAVDDGGSRVCVSWEDSGKIVERNEGHIHRIGEMYLDPLARDVGGMIPRALYPVALSRLCELYAQLYG